MDAVLYSLLQPRDGVDSHKANPRGDQLANLSIVFAILAGCFVGARLLTKYFQKSLWVDDCLIVFSLQLFVYYAYTDVGKHQILAVCQTVTYNGEAHNGFGLHNSDVDLHHKTLAFKWFFAAQIIYKVAVCSTKASLCFMYWRIFPDRKFRILTMGALGLTVAYTIGAVLLTVFACDPISKAWNKTAPGKCVDSRSIWYSTSVLNIVTDLMIIGLPVDQIRRLQLPLGRKIALAGLFSLGIFVIACTVIRMITVSPQTTASDQTFYQATSNSWTFVETDVGIICSSLPFLRVPVSKFFRNTLGIGGRKTNTGIGSNFSKASHSQGPVTDRDGKVISRVRGTRINDSESDSVEDLILQGKENINGPGIMMTRTIRHDVRNAADRV